MSAVHGTLEADGRAERPFPMPARTSQRCQTPPHRPQHHQHNTPCLDTSVSPLGTQKWSRGTRQPGHDSKTNGLPCPVSSPSELSPSLPSFVPATETCPRHWTLERRRPYGHMHPHISRHRQGVNTVPLHIAVAVRRRGSLESRLIAPLTHPDTSPQRRSAPPDLPFASITAAPARHPNSGGFTASLQVARGSFVFASSW